MEYVTIQWRSLTFDAISLGAMPNVLLIDDDPDTLMTCSDILRRAGFGVVSAHSGHLGLSLAKTLHPDVILADLRLPDISGIDILRQLKDEHLETAFVIVTGWGTVSSAADAMRLGAVDYIEKPLIGDDLVRVVEKALVTKGRLGPALAGDSDKLKDDHVESHAAARWAHAVLLVIDCPNDPKTLVGWSRCIGASVGTIRNWCRTAGVSSKGSLNFARLLRAVILHQTQGKRPEDLLDVVDKRTLHSLLQLGRQTHDRASELPGSIDDFLQFQAWIRDVDALNELQRLLRSRGLQSGHPG
jgi:ActR/RegA family two-component response regulator